MDEFVKKNDLIAAIRTIPDGRWDTKRYIHEIELVPPVDVRENLRAYQEIVDAKPYFKKHYRRICCSNCKREVLKSWSFCPDCGAQFIKEKSDAR